MIRPPHTSPTCFLLHSQALAGQGSHRVQLCGCVFLAIFGLSFGQSGMPAFEGNLRGPLGLLEKDGFVFPDFG